MPENNKKIRQKNLASLMKAESLAIVGISEPDRFGGIVYNNLRVMGYKGKIYGVNPKYQTLYDQKVYPSLSDLPKPPDCAVMAISNSRLLPIFKEAAELSIPSSVIFSSAYGENNGVPLQDALIHTAEKSGMIICGPNCMGILSYHQKLAMSGYPVVPGKPAGNITFISHSGSVWDAMLQNNRDINFNYVISSGNEIVTTMADYMEFALSDPTTKVIGLFLETVRDPDKFCEALEQSANHNIPVVALKVGRSKRGAQLAEAHSGALVGEDATYDALFKYYGVQRVRSLDEMMDTLELFETGMRPHNSKLSAILDSGGERSMLVDLAEDQRIDFTELEPNTITKLEEILEPGVVAENPLDAFGTEKKWEEVFTAGMQVLDSDPNTGLTTLCIDLYPMNTEPPTYEAMTIRIKDKFNKPFVVLANASATAADFKTAQFREVGIPVLIGTETGLRAIKHVFDYAEFQRHFQNINSSKNKLIKIPSKGKIADIRKRLQSAVKALDEVESKQILSEYGIAISTEKGSETIDQALSAAEKIGYPVALKTAAGSTHKTEVRGIHLNITDSDELISAYKDLESRLGPQVVVQEMVAEGIELLLGIVNDPQFGPLLMVGIGGIMVEVLKDTKLIWLPTDANKIKDAIFDLKFAEIFKGVRGHDKSDLEAIIDTVLRLALFAADCGDLIAELDINPLIAGPKGAVVVDALIIPKSIRGDE